MVSVLVSVLNGESAAEHPLLLSHSAGWGTAPIDAVMFSGGVSECVYYPERDDPSVYSDIGRMLAEKLNRSLELRNWEWVTPEETVRATVCGAGMQTTEISGATIQIDKTILPLKNLPVIEVPITDMNEAEKSVSQKIEQAIALYDPQEEGNNFALYFSDLPQLSFKNVQHLASVICSAYRQRKSDAPIVAVVKNDMAKVLGQSIMAFSPERPIICIDQLNVVNGDYVDIGRMLDSGVVPVVIKTLAFQ
jgi:ethanolamine utilization protein EutA